MREEAVPFGQGKLRVNGAKNGDKMILESADGTFGGVGAVFFWWNALKLDIVFLERVFEILGAFVVKDV